MPFSIFPRTVYQTTSKISGEIVVKEQFGQTKLYVQDVLQSGGIVRGIWKKPIKKVEKVVEVEKVEKVLVLGLGGGTVVKLIKKYWPEAKIVGVEIDPEIIKIGRKYFDLGRIDGLQIVQTDAFDWVAACLNDSNHLNKGFGLIIIDVYLGKEYPKRAESENFLEDVKKLLSKGGIAIFNRLRVREANLAGFEKKLKKHFSSVEKVRTPTNLFFLARS